MTDDEPRKRHPFAAKMAAGIAAIEQILTAYADAAINDCGWGPDECAIHLEPIGTHAIPVCLMGGQEGMVAITEAFMACGDRFPDKATNDRMSAMLIYMGGFGNGLLAFGGALSGNGSSLIINTITGEETDVADFDTGLIAPEDDD